MIIKSILSLFVIVLSLQNTNCISSYEQVLRKANLVITNCRKMQKLHNQNVILYQQQLSECNSTVASLRLNSTAQEIYNEGNANDLENKMKLIECLNKTLSETRNNLSLSENTIATLEQHLSENKTALNAKIQEVALQTATIRDMKTTIANLNDRIKSLETATRRTTETLNIKDIELTNAKANLISSTNRVNEKNHEIDALKSQVNANENKILELNDIIASYAFCCKANSCEPFGNSTSVHAIDVSGVGTFKVLCNGQLNGPGWTVIQKRINGNVDFYRNWTEYRNGFGSLSDEFFIGLEKLHHMTAAERQEIYIEMKDFNGETRYAHYDNFEVGSEKEVYALKSLGAYSGNVENLLVINAGQKFSTFDQDNDRDEVNCAELLHGGWWYQKCGQTNLNGRYKTQDDDYDNGSNGIFWADEAWMDPQSSLKSVQIMIRPKK